MTKNYHFHTLAMSGLCDKEKGPMFWSLIDMEKLQTKIHFPLLWGAGKNELRPADLTVRSCIILFVIIYVPASTDHIQLLETVRNSLIFNHALLLSQTWAQYCLLVFLKTLELRACCQKGDRVPWEERRILFSSGDICLSAFYLQWDLNLLPVQAWSHSFIKEA